MTVHFVILRVAALLVPQQERAEWLAEWSSELWYVLAERPRNATPFCLGAFRDGFWCRRNIATVDSPKTFSPVSPLRCLMLLAVLAGASVLSAIHETGAIRIRAHVLMILIALVVLPVVTSLDFGHYPENHHSRSRRWMFFAAKVVLLVATVLFGTLILVSVGAAPILGETVLIGYVLAFRWAVLDQRRRCPVCLHLLTNPVRMGQSSRIFLAWYGIELICAKGHGVLHVPEIPTSCYRTPRWLDLDPCLK